MGANVRWRALALRRMREWVAAAGRMHAKERNQKVTVNKLKSMKNMHIKIFALALLGAAGCAAPSQQARLAGVGPGPAEITQNADEGFLQVYSARERVPININGEEFVWNNDFGRNEFLYGAAHTSYALYDQSGRLLQHVSNSTGMNDAHPTLLGLSPGAYQIKAEAADYDGVISTVTVPVCIEPGLTTLVHLDGKWNPSLTDTRSQWVRLANGSVVGWHCSSSEEVTTALQARN
jgi:hypothetical protein